MPYDNISSRPAYQENPKDKAYCRNLVFLTVRKLGSCNDRELSEFLNWPINRVTPRRGELVETGKIVLDKKAVDPVTNRTVSYWIERPENWQPVLF